MSDNQKLLEEFIEAAWNNGDLTDVERYIADAYTIHHDPGDPWEGRTLTRDEFKERVELSRKPFPDQTFTIEHALQNESGVAIAWTWSGTHTEDLDQFAASGQPIRMSGATLYFFEDGRITGHWQISDRLSVYQQLMSNQGTGP